MRVLRLVTEIDDGMEDFVVEDGVVENEGNVEGQGDQGGQSENVELKEDTVRFLDPQTLLKMIIGFHSTTPGSDYEIATRGLRKLCLNEAIRRLDIEYRSRGCVAVS